MKLLPLLLLAAALHAAPPHVVLIISDDHAWSDYGFIGHPDVRTPYIDKLASESLLFTRGYVPTSLCRASLASIMTGLYPHQHRITVNDPDGSPRDAANRARMVEIFSRSKTLAGLLGNADYASLQTGKWWEGNCTCCGFTSCMTHGDVSRGGRHGDEGLKIGRETMQPVYEFIDKAEGKPFFLWYAPMMPHTPHNPPARLLSRYSSQPDAVARYYAMIEWFDETVGQLLAYLDKKQLSKDTIVVYLADNGWVQPPDPQPLFATRAKMSPFDAGLRTPIMVRWPGKVKPLRDDRTLASSIDLAPTILAAAGRKPEKNMPGIDLRDSSRLRARKSIFGASFVHTAIDVPTPERNLKYRWVIRDQYKLIVPHQPNLSLPLWENRPETAWFKEAQLFDVVEDPRESLNLIEANPAIVKRLRAELDRWWNP
ncbi:MAG: sulfatase [Acidimicrobiia bacterium]|nr:sulfatase [Acidimicrobiia bacterium]